MVNVGLLGSASLVTEAFFLAYVLSSANIGSICSSCFASFATNYILSDLFGIFSFCASRIRGAASTCFELIKFFTLSVIILCSQDRSFLASIGIGLKFYETINPSRREMPFKNLYINEISDTDDTDRLLKALKTTLTIYSPILRCNLIVRTELKFWLVAFLKLVDCPPV